MQVTSGLDLVRLLDQLREPARREDDDPAAAGVYRAGGPGQGEVAGTPGDLGESPARRRGPLREGDLGEQLVRRQGGGQRTFHELGHGKGPASAVATLEDQPRIQEE